jgi:penicillin-binding protein 2
MVTGLILLIFTGLVAQLGNLTLRQERQYRDVVTAQSTRSLPVFASRGIMYDRNMEPLVTNRPANSVFVRYPYYKQPEVLQRLSAILQVPMPEIDKLVKDKLASEAYYDPIRVKDDITPSQYATILERKPELPGVEVQSQPVRVYPLKDSAAHVLGYVNQISQEQLTQLKPQGYQPGELVGRTGLEAFYEQVLRGKPGIRQVEINSYGQPLGVVQSVDPQPGNSVVLTLDAKLQAAAERALEWDMWRIRNTVIGDGPWPTAKAGAVVVMEVKTGKILAMASRPSFDPNMFARGITQKELETLQDPVLTPELNRAVQTAYQPGSTWKMMTASSALENGVVGPYEQVFCSGVFDKLHHPHDWTPYGHGLVDTAHALQTSCDIYFYEMGYRLGIDRLVATAKEFGFGAKTGIDLGGENPGMLPDAANREEIWAKQQKDPWGPGHTVSAAIGQIVNVTPLQLVRYAATLGNEGKIMKPYLVDKVVDASGKTVQQFAPQQMGQVNLRPEYLSVILQGMGMVNAPNVGTSDYAIYPLPGMKTGGKTGTAQYPPNNDYGFFVSLSPLNDPQIAIAVAIEQAGHGGNVSTVARSIESFYYNINLPDYDPAKVPDEFPNDIAGLRRKFRVVGTGQ